MTMPADQPVADQDVVCRHCGTSYSAKAGADPRCPECGRYQDSIICPTCGQLARASLMKEGDVPAAAKPKKGSN